MKGEMTMNLTMLSGTMGPLNESNVFIRADGATVVDSYIFKTYQKDEKVFDSHFYFTIAGSKADKLLKHFKEGDRAMVTGKLATRVDDDGHYWVVIVASNITKMDNNIETDF